MKRYIQIDGGQCGGDLPNVAGYFDEPPVDVSCIAILIDTKTGHVFWPKGSIPHTEWEDITDDILLGLKFQPTLAAGS